MKERKINLKDYIISGIIATAISSGTFCLYFFLNETNFYYACNASGLAAVVSLSIGGLMYVSREGFFDIFAYGFKQLGSQLFGRDPIAHNDFPGYKEDKRVLRSKRSKNFISFLLVGGLFLILFVIFRILMPSM